MTTQTTTRTPYEREAEATIAELTTYIGMVERHASRAWVKVTRLERELADEQARHRHTQRERDSLIHQLEEAGR